MKIIVFNSGIKQPKDKKIFLKDIIENCDTDRDKSYCVDANYYKGGNEKNYLEHARRQLIITGGAFRGRNPENPLSRESGLDTVQMLETRDDGKTNTLTTVQKDNVCVMIGNADINGNDSIKRVYSPEGKSPCLTAIQGGNQEPKVYIPGFENKKSVKMQNRVINNMKNLDEKGNCLLASNYKGAQSNGSTVILDRVQWRKLTVTECERLQTVPDGYCKAVSNSRAYHALGNGWTVDVISHILKQSLQES